MAVGHPHAVAIPQAAPTAEVQSVAVAATGGTWKLTFNGEDTSPVAWNVTAANLENAIDNLASMDDGDVEVTGGPGDATGSTPYVLTWLATHGNVAQPIGASINLTGTGTVTVGTTTPGAGGLQVSAEAGLLYGWSFMETAGGAAKLYLRDSPTPHGDAMAFVSLTANQAVVNTLGSPVRFQNGLYVERISGTTIGSVWIQE